MSHAVLAVDRSPRTGLPWVAATLLVLSGSMARAQTGPQSRPAPGQPSAPASQPRLAGETPPDYSTVVRATRPRETASEQRIDRRALQSQPHRSGNDLLRAVPGMLAVSHGAEGKGLQFFLRGFDTAHGRDVELVVGGVPINELSNIHGQGYVDLGFVIPEAVSSLEVFKGPFRLFQGDFATAGTIRLKLGVPAEERGVRLSYEVGSTWRHRLLGLWAPRRRPDDTFVAVEALADEGYGQNRGTRRASILGSVRLLRPLSVMVALHGSEFGSPGTLPLADVESGRARFYDSYTPNLKGQSARALLAATLAFPSRALEGVLRAQARRFNIQDNYTGWLIDPINGDAREQRQTAWQVGARLSWEPRLLSSLKLITSAGWVGDLIDQREDHLDPTGLAIGVNRELSILQQGAFAVLGARWTPFSWLALDGGLRSDLFHFWVDDRQLGVTGARDLVGQLSPRLTAVVPLGRFTIYLAGGRGVRAPEARSVTAANLPSSGPGSDRYLGGEPRVSAAESVEVGLGFRHGMWNASLAGFGTWMQHELIFDHVSGLNLEMNSTRRLGGELSLAFVFREWLRVRADLTAVNAVFVGSGNPIPGAPWLLAMLHVDFRHRIGAYGGLEAFYVAPRALANGATAAAAGNIDLLAGWRWRWIDLSVQVDNILGLKWQEGVYHFASWWDRATPRSAIPSIHFAAGPPRALRATTTIRF